MSIHWFVMSRDGIDLLLHDLDSCDRHRSVVISTYDKYTRIEGPAPFYNVRLTGTQLKRLREMRESETFKDRYGIGKTRQ